MDTMDKTFEDFSIDADLCLSAPSALRLLEEREFDLLVLDFDSKGAMGVMDSKGSNTHKHPSAVIAITRGPSVLKTAINKRVCFEVQKPFTADLRLLRLQARCRCKPRFLLASNYRRPETRCMPPAA